MKTDAQWLDRFVKMDEKWKKDAEGWLEYMEVRIHSCYSSWIRSKFQLTLFISSWFLTGPGQVSEGESYERHLLLTSCDAYHTIDHARN
jgi:hypothetical protein